MLSKNFLLFILLNSLYATTLGQNKVQVFKSYSRGGQSYSTQKLVILETGNYIDNSGVYFQNATETILKTLKENSTQNALLLQLMRNFLKEQKNIASVISGSKEYLQKIVDSLHIDIRSTKGLENVLDETKAIADKTEVEKLGSDFYINTSNLLTDQSVVFKSDFLQQDIIPIKKHNAYGYCDSTGKIVIDYQFDEATPFDRNLAVVKKNGEWYFINKVGEATIKLGIASKIYALFKGYALALIPRDVGINRPPVDILQIIDSTGQHAYTGPYSVDARFLLDCRFGKIIIKYKEGYQVYNYHGKKLFMLNYDELTKMSDRGISIIKKGHKYGYYDIVNNKLISDPRYYYVEPFNFSSAIVLTGLNNYGLINENNFTLIEFGVYTVIRVKNTNFLKFTTLTGNALFKKKNSFITSEDLKCISGDCDFK